MHGARSVRSLAVGLPVTVMTLFLCSCGSAGAGSAGASERGSARPVIHTLDFRPLAYFDQHCSRCHGPFGSYYGKDFAADLSPEALREKISEMAAGPGGAPVSGDSLAVLVAFHQSLSSGRPFITITGAGGDSLTGEVSPGASLQLICGDQTATPEVTGYHWVTQEPEWLGSCPPEDLRLTAGNGTAITVLYPTESAYSQPTAAQ